MIALYILLWISAAIYLVSAYKTYSSDSVDIVYDFLNQSTLEKCKDITLLCLLTPVFTPVIILLEISYLYSCKN